MAVPILTLYVIGVVLVLIGMESEGENGILYFALGFAVNTMAYYLSYNDADYLSTAYLPMILMAVCILKLIYIAWKMLPIKTDWESHDMEEN